MKKEVKYETYLRKFSDTYMTKYDEDNTWIIKCNQGGKIGVWSLSTDPVELYFTTNYGSGQKKTFAKKKYPPCCTIRQEGDWDIVVSFPEYELADLVNIFSIKRRNRISDEAREQMSQRMKKVREGELIGRFKKS